MNKNVGEFIAAYVNDVIPVGRAVLLKFFLNNNFSIRWIQRIKVRTRFAAACVKGACAGRFLCRTDVRTHFETPRGGECHGGKCQNGGQSAHVKQHFDFSRDYRGFWKSQKKVQLECEVWKLFTGTGSFIRFLGGKNIYLACLSISDSGRTGQGCDFELATPDNVMQRVPVLWDCAGCLGTRPIWAYTPPRLHTDFVYMVYGMYICTYVHNNPNYILDPAGLAWVKFRLSISICWLVTSTDWFEGKLGNRNN